MAPSPKRSQVRRSRSSKLGRLVTEARKLKRHNKTSCSRLLGVSPTTVTNWEEHGMAPIQSQRAGLAQYLSMSLDEIDRICPPRRRK